MPTVKAGPDFSVHSSCAHSSDTYVKHIDAAFTAMRQYYTLTKVEAQHQICGEVGGSLGLRPNRADSKLLRGTVMKVLQGCCSDIAETFIVLWSATRSVQMV